MDNYSVFIIAFLIGLLYFGLISLFVYKFHFKYGYGSILPLSIVLFFFVMMIVRNQKSINGWEGLAYLILMILAICILIGYISGWVFVVLLKKAKK